MNGLLLEKYIKVSVQKALKEQEEQIKKSEKSMFLIYRFPHLKKCIEDLMSPAFGRYVSNVSIVSPKPTTFRIDLINNQDFIIYYRGRGEFTAKIAGKKYSLEKLGELSRASDGITELLQLNYAPEEGKDIDQLAGEQGTNNSNSSFTPPPDPGLGALDGLDSPDFNPALDSNPEAEPSLDEPESSLPGSEEDEESKP